MGGTESERYDPPPSPYTHTHTHTNTPPRWHWPSRRGENDLFPHPPTRPHAMLPYCHSSALARTLHLKNLRNFSLSRVADMIISFGTFLPAFASMMKRFVSPNKISFHRVEHERAQRPEPRAQTEHRAQSTAPIVFWIMLRLAQSFVYLVFFSQLVDSDASFKYGAKPTTRGSHTRLHNHTLRARACVCVCVCVRVCVRLCACVCV